MSATEASREDRQLPASERRLEQARAEGQVVRSRDLGHFATLAVCLGIGMGLGPWLVESARDLISAGLRIDRALAMDTGAALWRAGAVGMSGMWLALPLIAILSVVSLAASMAIGGWNIAGKALMPQFSRVDPMAGLGRIFALRHLVDHGRVVLVAAGLLGIAAWHVWRSAESIQTLGRMPLERGLLMGFDWILSGLLALLAIAAAAALVDVPLQIFKHKADLRMTLEEVKQENKESEGNPHIKGERRRRQRAMSRSRMLAAVPAADVVVVNPSHYAVALRYDDSTMRAPCIVAMGVDHVALRIRAKAQEFQVPILDAPPLARALYRHGEVDSEVPVVLYGAVAQVLAYVALLRRSVRGAVLPHIAVPPGLDPLEGQS